MADLLENQSAPQNHAIRNPLIALNLSSPPWACGATSCANVANPVFSPGCGPGLTSPRPCCARRARERANRGWKKAGFDTSIVWSFRKKLSHKPTRHAELDMNLAAAALRWWR